MLLMDRDNLFARGWSHVLSSSNNLEELETFRQRIGAPPQALHRKNPERPHLDLRGKIRDLALACPDVTVFERSSELVRHHKAVSGKR